MHVEYDPDADAVYIRLRHLPYIYGRDLDDSRRIDYGSDDQPIGFELLNVSMGVNLDDLPERNAVGRLLTKHDIKAFARK